MSGEGYIFPPHQEKLGSRQVIHDKMRKSEGEKPEKEVEEKGLRPEPGQATAACCMSVQRVHRQCWGHAQGSSVAHLRHDADTCVFLSLWATNMGLETSVPHYREGETSRMYLRLKKSPLSLGEAA